ncbi:MULTISPECIES: OmpA family protein [Chryseobacterium group]|uniref:OmpA family protein n=1 Tax=Chryseobacterium group TaxID=2782232 RepID=UPI0012A8EC9F|nr:MULTISPECIES: OmpA family protein [Chryseobacterium group]MDF0718611.1 OmpA family protein [Kaistella sp. PBT33-4]QFG53909.1 OmpA family protein [Chryseobacterium sp.]
MKLRNTYIAGITAALMLTSCETIQNSNHQQRGTVVGASTGAVIGGVLGNNVGKGGNAPAGAVLGGIIGGVAGNVIGRKMDQQAKEIKQTLPGAEVERVNEGIKVTLPERMVNFGFDSSELSATSRANLDKLADILKNNEDTNINIYGHTDSKGTDSYNQALSERRAAAVKSYLVGKGVASSRMYTMGMGESDPKSSNDTEAGRADNRRVEFAITANENMIKEAQQEQ